MAIENIGDISNYKLNLVETTNTKQTTSDNASIFEAFLNSSSKMYSETNALQKEAEMSQLAFATGESDNILEVMLAQEKATTALNFTVQVTNKLVEAYKEIQQIQL